MEKRSFVSGHIVSGAAKIGATVLGMDALSKLTPGEEDEN